MDWSSSVLGSGVVAKLQARRSAFVCEFGRDGFTRADFAAVDCFNYQAAATLSAAVKPLHVKDTRDLFDRVSPAELAVPRVGSIAIAVLGAAFQKRGIGGASPLEAWVKKHAGAEGVRTFVTFKAHEAAERAEERKAARHTRESRRAKAHRLRRDRFLARSGG